MTTFFPSVFFSSPSSFLSFFYIFAQNIVPWRSSYLFPYLFSLLCFTVGSPVLSPPKKDKKRGHFCIYLVISEFSRICQCLDQVKPSSWASLIAQLVKNPPAMWETLLLFLGWEDPLEKGKAKHASILPWRIPWTVHGVAKSRTGLSNFHFHFSTITRLSIFLGAF